MFLQLTGRVEEKRRWSEGIHQAVEAKEGLKIQVYAVLCFFYFVLWHVINNCLILGFTIIFLYRQIQLL